MCPSRLKNMVDLEHREGKPQLQFSYFTIALCYGIHLFWKTSFFTFAILLGILVFWVSFLQEITQHKFPKLGFVWFFSL